MPSFKAPLRDHLFCLFEIGDFERQRRLPGLADLSRDVVEQVLAQSARFAEEVLAPLNRAADEEGVRFNDGMVTTPKGFREAYRALCDGGWPSLTCDPADGGQGLPHTLNVLFEEMMGGACLSFGLFPGLTRGAYVLLTKFGSMDQRQTYAAKLASGEWAGAMCLTEPHCGTDLGLLRTAARPMPEGAYAISGTKSFISAGEHDLTPNIIYLVLARLPDAPLGTRGISLFLVPKILPNGDRNSVLCSAIERKMGIHASPTCIMNFDGAKGWLVGEPHEGLKAMFAMMNAERLAVGIQGLAQAEASYQNAVAYARERLQGRAADRPVSPGRPADPIIVHADVRRMLLTQKALVEGCRMLALEAASLLDAAERHSDPIVRRQMENLVALLTPVVKAFLTDCGSDVANLGLQVLGGFGYMRDNGQEQYVRDVRITQIYEGTNGIQAMDFLGRKILADGGKALDCYLSPIELAVQTDLIDPRLAPLAAPVAEALRLTRDATALVMTRAATKADETGAAASGFLRLFALTTLGHHWLRAARIALPHSSEDFYRAKLVTARFFMARLLPETKSLHAAIASGAATIMDMEPDLF